MTEADRERGWGEDAIDLCYWKIRQVLSVGQAAVIGASRQYRASPEFGLSIFHVSPIIKFRHSAASYTTPLLVRRWCAGVATSSEACEMGVANWPRIIIVRFRLQLSTLCRGVQNVLLIFAVILGIITTAS